MLDLKSKEQRASGYIKLQGLTQSRHYLQTLNLMQRLQIMKNLLKESLRRIYVLPIIMINTTVCRKNTLKKTSNSKM